MANYGLGDLPDEAKIADDAKLILSGRSAKAMIGVIKRLWRGENVTTSIHGGGVRKDENGDSGYSLFTSQSSTQTGSSRALWVYDASTGSTPRIGVTPGAFNGSIIPTIGSVPINTTTGMPPLPPYLTLSGGDTLAWFELTYNSSNVLTAAVLNKGTTLPVASIVRGTAGTDYFGASSVEVTTGEKASVVPLNDFTSGPQGYRQCGTSSECWLM